MLRLAAILWLVIVSFAAGGPRVDIVIGLDATQAHQFAASELSEQLKRLFDADVRTIDNSPSAPHVIVLSHQDGVSEQTFTLKSIKLGDHQGLQIGGGSPAATLWAVYEYGHRMGIRYFLFGDLYPVKPPPFTLDGFDVAMTPFSNVRSFSLHDGAVAGTQMWTIDEHQQLFRQLTKLKFNRIAIAKEAHEPSVSIRVDGDTGGRSAFRGAKLFESPNPLTQQHRQHAKRELGITFVAEPTVSVGVLPHVDDTWTRQVGDLDLAAYYSSRTALGEKLTPEQACHDLVTPVCGEEVSTRVWKAMEFCRKASSLIAKNDPALDLPLAAMLLKHERNDPPPAWWTEARDHYLNAMNEMYRANTRAREGGRAYTLYHARRFEFAFQYMNCLMAVRKAGVAKAKGDEDTRVTELEAAVEAIYGALNALAAVARSNTDRAVIALLNEYGYRPLKKELDAAGQ